MSNNTSKVLIFVSGATCGALVANFYLKSRYEKRYQEDVDSMKETLGRILATENEDVEENDDIRKKAEEAKEKPGILEYAAMLQKQGYTSYRDHGSKDESEEEEPNDDSEETEAEEDVEETELEKELSYDRPYVIEPEEFGEFDDYERISLKYYADGILTDDQDELVDDVEETVGFDSLSKFGMYEDDSVHVRNDRLKADYEILKMTRRYSDIAND